MLSRMLLSLGVAICLYAARSAEASFALDEGRNAEAVVTAMEDLLLDARPWESGRWSALAAPGSPEATARLAEARRLLAAFDRMVVSSDESEDALPPLRLDGVRRAVRRFIADADDPYEPALITGASEPLRVLDAFLSQPPAPHGSAAEGRLEQGEQLAAYIEAVAENVRTAAIAGRPPSRESVTRVIDATSAWSIDVVRERLRAMVLADSVRSGPRDVRSIELRLRARTSTRLTEAVEAYRRTLLDDVLPTATEAPGWSGSEAGRRAFGRAAAEALGADVDPSATAAQARLELRRVQSEIILLLKDGRMDAWRHRMSALTRSDLPSDDHVVAELLVACRRIVAEDAFQDDDDLLRHAAACAKHLDAAHLQFVRTPVVMPYGIAVGHPAHDSVVTVSGDLVRGEPAMMHLPPAAQRVVSPQTLPVLLREHGIVGRMLAMDRSFAAGGRGSDPMVTAFAEAWGLYAARRTSDPDDAVEQMFLLLRELDVAAQWAAETMMHIEGASIDDVRQMLNVFRTPFSDDPERTLRRIMDQPGVRSVIKPMELHLRKIARSAGTRLGGVTNDRTLHEVLLHGGAASPAGLRGRADAWLQRLPIGMSFD